MSRTWTQADDTRLRRAFKGGSYASLATQFDRTAVAIRQRCYLLGLRKKAPDWTGSELARLRAVYADPNGPIHIDALSQELGRPRSSISTKAAELGLSSLRRVRPDGFGARMAVKQNAWLAENDHPRGMLGKKHTDEARRRQSDYQILNPRTYSEDERQARSDILTARHMAGTVTPGGNAYSRCKHGRRPDLGDQYFRSAWEANYARFLNLLKAQGGIASWEYEADTFWFETIRRGVRSYTPDFKVTEPRGTIYYVEVKGWMDPKSATKIKRMAKYHPAVDLRVVGERAYRELARKLGPALPGWER